ncbi:Cyclic di-GMP phosphodiesterase CdgJ [Vibrio marisflavi CECT 7928]|uniref:Cyclic di-GMP phosphodiesterase CdgJ n=1 Tax=Vibrio marisflavi CECT 7928 TaxID=634439 RepID=A0ABN8E2Q9_9VIBR|nr:Cyclic di-GMP phosphodiesterase CdgJ [Vibrio marisflavi CECT 7928]
MDRKKKTIGYEVLFRDGPNNTFPEIDPELATSRLLSDHFLSTHYKTLGNHLGFVNFPYKSLLNRIPTLFPSESLVVEILEDCEPTIQLLEAVKEMSKLGYTMALDDFVPAPAWKPFYPYISIIKFDIKIISILRAKTFMRSVKDLNLKFLAEKVETHEEFDEAKQAGFDYFQGYFFSRPEMIQKKSLEPSFLTIVNLCKEIAKPNINYAAIEKLVSKDVSLSYKLLTYVNSSVYVRTKIQSFKQALVYLGEKRLRKFVSLVAIASTENTKPDYLYSLSIQRARHCELIYAKCKSNAESDEGAAFLTGMFSLLDSLLDQPLEVLVDEMPIEESVKDALVNGEGFLGSILTLSIAYEKAEWNKINEIASSINLSEADLTESYQEALVWTTELLSVVS